LLYLLLRRKKLMWSLLKMMLSSNPRSIACEVWSFHFQDKLFISDNLLIVVSLFSWYYYWLFTIEVTICMELDSNIHIVMHSVLSWKSGVTVFLKKSNQPGAASVLSTRNCFGAGTATGQFKLVQASNLILSCVESLSCYSTHIKYLLLAYMADSCIVI